MKPGPLFPLKKDFSRKKTSPKKKNSSRKKTTLKKKTSFQESSAEVLEKTRVAFKETLKILEQDCVTKARLYAKIVLEEKKTQEKGISRNFNSILKLISYCILVAFCSILLYINLWYLLPAFIFILILILAFVAKAEIKLQNQIKSLEQASLQFTQLAEKIVTSRIFDTEISSTIKLSQQLGRLMKTKAVYDKNSPWVDPKDREKILAEMEVEDFLSTKNLIRVETASCAKQELDDVEEELIHFQNELKFQK